TGADSDEISVGGTSALGVLRCLTGLLQAVLLTLDGTRVTREEAGALERGAILGGDLGECTRDGETQRAGLAGRAAAVQTCVDVERLGALDRHQGRLHELLVHLVREVV